MTRHTTIGIALLACAGGLTAADAVAQYRSLGISIGGGTTSAVHGSMHLGNTDKRRRGYICRGKTESELVVGLPIYAWAEGGRTVGPSLGLNLRRTSEEGFSAGFGFRIAPAPSGSTSGYRMVFHVPFGLEPYPLPARLFFFAGLGGRLVR